MGAFYNGVCKSWAHFIAGLCLQPWPEHELKSWAHFKRELKIVGAFYSGTMPAALAPEGIENVGVFYNGDLQIVGTFCSGTMPPALAKARIEIVGAF